MKTDKSRIYGLAISVILWSALVIWTGAYWFLLCNLIFIDIWITRIFDWSLKRYNIPDWIKKFIEWLTLIMAAILLSILIKVFIFEAYKIPSPSMEETLKAGDYILVSKLAYGPRLPNTPLALPFVPNQFHSGKKTYSEKILMPYKRLKGISHVKRNDIIVFFFPEGDTMVVQYPGQNYYSLIRQYGRDYIRDNFDIITHPVDRRENYIKRCIGLPGDQVQIINGNVFVNGRHVPFLPGMKFKYYLKTRSEQLPETLLDSLKILKSDFTYNPANSLHVIYLTMHQADILKHCPEVTNIQRFVEPVLSFHNP